ncbi:VOC family protein [Pontibacillus marinus]|uniref:VOC domain-containing protein n=1 Tax=Pontibacillus marinus BH030004 = DSM 16465 TaxID=1385511 RepID=A0A0A5GH61_9BACI|nr:hypothetical protein [Pontibacillus marinus]KGX90450.1 hypothetical protein N783_16885 [Pontibacillus marinus BH030004 = DSM 16465]
MQLFHYHWWTDKPEEMERFYQELGFETNLRVGNYKGEMQTFKPPLEWEDFRDEEVRFRIIQMVKGQTNITFGQGKRDTFDHIGILVDESEYSQTVEKAQEIGWKVSEGERRTFISTPWKFKIELQKRTEVVTEEEHTFIKTMEILLPFSEKDLKSLRYILDLNIAEQNSERVEMGNPKWNLVFRSDEQTRLNSVKFHLGDEFNINDPVKARLIGQN